MDDTTYQVEDFEEAAGELVSFGRRLISDGLAIGSAGNLSIRLGDVVAITPSSVAYANVEPQDVCLVNFDGVKVTGRGAISSEWPMHSGIYRATAASAIAHTHSPEVVALSITREELPAVHYAIVGLGGPVPVVGYTRFGSDGLAERVVEALQSHRAAILENHGAVTYGDTLGQAYDRALLLEWLAGVYRRSLHYGEPRILSADELDEVAREVARRRYGEPSSAAKPS